eukprot:TRINITY_DN30384_c0_g1_i1.p1 TRINITY_DN30384_c0_g1~~TRINITY_DN30384_c0_g1_i1.p1  ORF type:complete len:781 (+),score=230.01 TRINITY_DN30384_c0_g1_i1:112-2454(+)
MGAIGDDYVPKGTDSRWSWNLFPSTRIEAARMVVPLGCVFAPLQDAEAGSLLNVEPQVCRSCGAVLNPFAQCDFRVQTWVCPLCNSPNNLPVQYNGMSESNLATELRDAYATVEYALRDQPVPPPFYLFVVDLCVGSANKDDLNHLRETLLKSLEYIPQDSCVGVVTFGTSVQVHDMTPAQQRKPNAPVKVFTLKGSKSFTTGQVAKLLNLKLPEMEKLTKDDQDDVQPTHLPGSIPNALFARFRDVKDQLHALFSSISTDPWPVAPHDRQRRCTGAALSVAAGIAEAVFPKAGGRIQLYLSGPCTEGPGKCVDINMANIIRGHNEIRDETPEAKHWASARAFYDKLSTKLVRNGHCVDAFLNALDQVGFAEMRSCVTLTGGTCVMDDSFGGDSFGGKFVDAYKKYWVANTTGADVHNAVLSVQTSPMWKISGALGPLVSTNKKSPSVSQDTEMGIGGTCEWRMATLNKNTHLAFYFEVVTVQNPGQHRYVQFKTKYQDPQGRWRLRVTTMRRSVAPPELKPRDFVSMFDQEAATVLISRLAVHKAEDRHVLDVMRWLDGSLIKLVSRFANYERDKPQTLQLPGQLSLFPQFMFHLRRSQYLQVFNSSPDETVFFRLWLDRESVANCLIMIQPQLIAFDTKTENRPCLLDSSSVSVDNILVLDTYFEVLVHYGQSICDWRDAKYHELPGYEHFAKLLSVPSISAKERVAARYPTPRFVESDHHSSQSRILYSVINPSTTHNQSTGKDGKTYGESQGEIVYTDDASLQTFWETLRKLAVQN